jgi:dTDP-4-dehydrorhamnose reductase
MKVLVTGGRGMLGRALVDALGGSHDVVPDDLEEMDVRDWGAVSARMDAVRPDLVIHAAAFTAVDDCEARREEAFAVNALGARNVAVAARRRKCPLVYISTDYVFDGRKGEPYTEFDEPAPLGVYGRSKWMGEVWVARHHPDLWIVRTAWTFGPGGKNFVRTILEQAGKGPHLRVVDDQVGSPTYTVDLAGALSELVERLPFGLYHLTNSGRASWHDLAVEALRVAGISAHVERIDTATAGRPAPRPRFSVLENLCWRRSGQRPLRPWQEAVSDYVVHPLR